MRKSIIFLKKSLVALNEKQCRDSDHVLGTNRNHRFLKANTNYIGFSRYKPAEIR